jgi:hypothetical protein
MVTTVIIIKIVATPNVIAKAFNLNTFAAVVTSVVGGWVLSGNEVDAVVVFDSIATPAVVVNFEVAVVITAGVVTVILVDTVVTGTAEFVVEATASVVGVIDAMGVESGIPYVTA